MQNRVHECNLSKTKKAKIVQDVLLFKSKSKLYMNADLSFSILATIQISHDF